jgi:hypothetical protein
MLIWGTWSLDNWNNSEPTYPDPLNGATRKNSWKKRLYVGWKVLLTCHRKSAGKATGKPADRSVLRDQATG